MEVWHMNGAGNDFLVVDGRGKTLDYAAMAKKLCAQYGTDGFMAVDLSKEADFRLHFYNADGSRGEMCGNGSRCVCRFAYEHGLVGQTMSVQTDAGLIYGQRLTQSQYEIRLNVPSILEPERKKGVAYVELGNPGLPHAVTEVRGLSFTQREQLRQQAVALRYDPAFPKGVNVNFYSRLGEGHIRILSYERGVEDYTLACGTGTGATAAVLWAQGKLPDGKLTAENPGGILTVEVTGHDGIVTQLLLQGPTEVTEVFEI